MAAFGSGCKVSTQQGTPAGILVSLAHNERLNYVAERAQQRFGPAFEDEGAPIGDRGVPGADLELGRAQRPGARRTPAARPA